MGILAPTGCPTGPKCPAPKYGGAFLPTISTRPPVGAGRVFRPAVRSVRAKCIAGNVYPNDPCHPVAWHSDCPQFQRVRSIGSLHEPVTVTAPAAFGSGYFYQGNKGEFMDNFADVLRYRIDAQDRIVSVAGAWDEFAIQNKAGDELLSSKIRSRSLWDFIAGDVVEHVYRAALEKVRRGKEVQFCLRCDSPDVRRVLSLRMVPTEADGVEFVSKTVHAERREPVEDLFHPPSEGTENYLVACSWCKKFRTGSDVWQEAEEAVHTLQLFEDSRSRAISHGMCCDCYDIVIERLNAGT